MTVLLAPGEVVCTEFAIERAIGEDPVATLYAATSARRPGERFVVRAASIRADRAPGMLLAFGRQMAALEALNHPAVSPVLDEDLREGCAVIVARAHDFPTLRDRIARGDPIPPAGVARVVGAVASALAPVHRHASPMTHGLLCPETLALGPAGEVRIDACGFVHALVAARLLERLREVHRAPAYLSPGALRDDPLPRDDAFVLASIVFECLAMEPAFAGETRDDVVTALTDGPRPSLHALRPDLAPEVDAVLHRAWDIGPGGGYGSVAEFARDLEGALGLPPRSTGRPATLPPGALILPSGRLSQSPPAPEPPPPAALPRRARAAWVLGTALVLAAAIETGGRLVRPVPPPRAELQPVAAPPHPATCPPAPAPACPPPAAPAPCTCPPASTPPSSSDAPCPVVPAAPSAQPAGAFAQGVACEGAPALPGGPRTEDLARVHAMLYDRIRWCLAGRRSERHLRVLITYDAATGRAREAQLVGEYARRPEAPCILQAARGAHVTPFGRGPWIHRWSLPPSVLGRPAPAAPR